MTEYKDRALNGTEVYWIQQKFKPKYAGKIGDAVLRYDVKQKRYYEPRLSWDAYPELDLSKTDKSEIDTEAPF